MIDAGFYLETVWKEYVVHMIHLFISSFLLIVNPVFIFLERVFFRLVFVLVFFFFFNIIRF